MKKCPNCSQDMSEEALRCEHCGEWHTESSISPNVQFTVNKSNGASIMNNHSRKIWIGVFLTLLSTGLGHLYCGYAKKGIALYIIKRVVALIIYSLILLVYYTNVILLAAGAVFLGISYQLYCVIDVIIKSRKSKHIYELKSYNRWYVYILYIVIGIVIIPLITDNMLKYNTIKSYKIPSGAMKYTLLIGDHFIINRFIYGIKNPFTGRIIIPIEKPRREDIIVFQYLESPELDFLKRVVGIEGDVIEVRNKKLYVNDILVERDYAIHTDPHIIPAVYNKRDNFGPVIVPPDSLFVMGDNRDNSQDSRFRGFVNLDAVKGKAFLIYWSWDNGNARWDRIGKRVDIISEY